VPRDRRADRADEVIRKTEALVDQLAETIGDLIELLRDFREEEENGVL
jgi:hypothetical protein